MERVISRPERSWARGPLKRMKIGLRKVWSAITPNFVVSTGAKRSGEICGFPHLAQRARQIWGTLDWWPFWIHTSSRFRVPHPCVARVGDHNSWQSRPSRMIFERAKRRGASHISTGVFMGSRPTQEDENRVEEGLVGYYTYLCHLDRSEAQWRDLRFPTSGAKGAPDMGHPRLVAILDPYFKQI